MKLKEALEKSDIDTAEQLTVARVNIAIREDEDGISVYFFRDAFPPHEIHTVDTIEEAEAIASQHHAYDADGWLPCDGEGL
jgi:hypothetical protein